MSAGNEPRVTAARGLGYSNEARRLEEEAKSLLPADTSRAQYGFERSRQLYLRAAEEYANAARLTSSEADRKSWENLARLYVEKGRALAPQPPPRIQVRQGGGGDSSSLEETFEIKPEKSDMTFEQVAGLDDVKEEIRLSIIQPMMSPQLYQRLGLKPGGGILLYGPPGCGKTFIGRAAAGQCKANFYNVKISDILSKYVGESEQHFSRMTEDAIKNAPSIIFLDEIDALGVSRDSADASHTARLVNQILSSMDGFSSKDAAKPVFWMATTNRPWAVDPAVRRPGRLDRTVFVPLPDAPARKKIFQLNTTAELVSLHPADYDWLAQNTEGYTSADIVDIAKSAKQIIAKEVSLEGKSERPVVIRDFQTALSQTKKSLVPWLVKAKNEIERSGEASEYPDLVNLIRRYLPSN